MTPQIPARRVLIEGDPFALLPHLPDQPLGQWPAQWIAPSRSLQAPWLAIFRCRFVLPAPATMRLHVTADERYILFADGCEIGRGSERGDERHWYFESYDWNLDAGSHHLAALVWAMGPDQAAFAQMSAAPGLLVAAQDPAHGKLVTTGVAPWEYRKIQGVRFADPLSAWGTGPRLDLKTPLPDASWFEDTSQGWTPVRRIHFARSAAQNLESSKYQHRLLPATLPPLCQRAIPDLQVLHVSEPGGPKTHRTPFRSTDHLSAEARDWEALFAEGHPLTIPPQTRRRVLLLLPDYSCAYVRLRTTGGCGASVRIHWQESLFNEKTAETKWRRKEVEGKYFTTIWWNKDGIGNIFRPTGTANETFQTLWWECGRYVEIVVETGKENLTIDRLEFRETQYPLEAESQVETDNEDVDNVARLSWRTLQMCAHETYMDCPYYEQLMYVGDTRLQVLATYAMTRDSRLPRKALQMFDWSRFTDGLTQSRYPSKIVQITPTFSLLWINMVHDWALWRGEPDFVRSLMPGVRAVLEAWCANLTPDGGIVAPSGWNFVDWVPKSYPGWEDGTGTPPHPEGMSAAFSLQVVLALQDAAHLENWLGEPARAARHQEMAERIFQRAWHDFWDAERQLLADDRGKTYFSEHAQVLALLSGRVPLRSEEQLIEKLFSTHDLAPCSIYFRHYLFEVMARFRQADQFVPKLDLWFDALRSGLTTAPEHHEPTRSDCHAWGAHPLYHLFATVLGIRPGGYGFETISLSPQLGSLNWARGSLAHAFGEIRVEVRQEKEFTRIVANLPDRLTGNLNFAGEEYPLNPGSNRFELERDTREKQRCDYEPQGLSLLSEKSKAGSFILS